MCILTRFLAALLHPKAHGQGRVMVLWKVHWLIRWILLLGLLVHGYAYMLISISQQVNKSNTRILMSCHINLLNEGFLIMAIPSDISLLWERRIFPKASRLFVSYFILHTATHYITNIGFPNNPRSKHQITDLLHQKTRMRKNVLLLLKWSWHIVFSEFTRSGNLIEHRLDQGRAEHTPCHLATVSTAQRI